MRRLSYLVLPFVILVLQGFTTLQAQQAYYFEYTNQSKKVYQNIIDLKLDSARLKLSRLTEDHPNNLVHLHLNSYIDFFELFISEDETLFKTREANKSEAIKHLEKYLKDDDPYKAYAIAEITLHWAIIRSKFGQLYKASREVISANKLLEQNDERFPDFILNKKSLSIIHSLAETVTIPGIIKKLVGLKGSIEQGRNEIESLIHHSLENKAFPFIEELDAIYLYILLYQVKDYKATLDYLAKSRLNPSKSPMATFLIAKIYQRVGMNEQALQTLQSRPDGEEYASFAYLDLSEGICKLRKLDPSSKRDILNFINNFKGRHFIKEAYQKLAWHALVLEDDFASYKSYLAKVADSGHKLVDADKQALNEAQTSKVSDPILLKARLLFDGGYYQKAYQLLTTNSFKYAIQNGYSLEFHYRIGRITHALKNYPEAIFYYQKTIEADKNSESYYSCNAALQLGLIFENQKQLARAKNYFNLCLEMDPKEYKTGLHQKARSGLQRLKERR